MCCGSSYPELSELERALENVQSSMMTHACDPVLEKWRQENQESNIVLDYIGN